MPSTAVYAHAVVVEGRQGQGQDRVAVAMRAWGILVVLADGAGGLGGGAEAADLVVERTHEAVLEPHDWAGCEALLGSLDRDLARDRNAGECTAVVAMISGDRVIGASVGDSVAWLVGPDGHQDLTRSQRRKPLLGSGSAAPVGFTGTVGPLTLLVASDGLWKYADLTTVTTTAVGPDLEVSARTLRDLARLPSGTLQDDVSIALVRRSK